MKYLSIIFLTISQLSVAQRIDTLNVGDELKGFNKLPFETYTYEVYSERGGKKTPAVLMTSKVSEKWLNGQKILQIDHNWEGPYGNGNFSALVKPKTLEPITQVRNTQKGKEAYRFTGKSIVGLDSVIDNVAADYNLQLDYPVFNFEIDLETFSCLPLEKNRKFVIPFFHAGNTYSPPKYYQLDVERDEELIVEGLGKVETWVLFMDYGGTQPTYFWYTKNDHRFIKMEASYRGAKIYKIRKY